MLDVATYTSASETKTTTNSYDKYLTYKLVLCYNSSNIIII